MNRNNKTVKKVEKNKSQKTKQNLINIKISPCCLYRILSSNLTEHNPSDVVCVEIEGVLVQGHPEGVKGLLVRLVREGFTLFICEILENEDGVEVSGRSFIYNLDTSDKWYHSKDKSKRVYNLDVSYPSHSE